MHPNHNTIVITNNNMQYTLCLKYAIKIVLFDRDKVKSWTYLTTNQFSIKEKNMQIHKNPSHSY